MPIVSGRLVTFVSAKYEIEKCTRLEKCRRRFSTSISDDEERHFLCPTCCSVQGILLFLSGSFSLKKLYRIVTDTHKESSVRAHIDRRRCENNFHIAQEILTQKAIYSHSFSARMVQIVWHNQNIRAFL